MSFCNPLFPLLAWYKRIICCRAQYCSLIRLVPTHVVGSVHLLIHDDAVPAAGVALAHAAAAFAVHALGKSIAHSEHVAV